MADLTAGEGVTVLGTKAIALQLVERLAAAELGPLQLVTWDDTDDVRSRRIDLEDACKRLHVPIAVVRRTPDAYASIRQANPSLVLVAGWYRLIPDDVLDNVPNGFVGVHYSPLPRYRGSAPVVWQLINGEESVGFSLFRLGSEMDAGALAGSGFVPAGSGYIGDVLDRLDAAALDELVRITPGLLTRTHTFAPQAAGRPSYTSMRTPGDGHVDWTRPAAEIVRAIRAQSRPYPGAWSSADEAVVRIWRASIELSADYYGVPGHVARVIDEKPVIACGDGGGVLLEEFDGARLGLASRLA